MNKILLCLLLYAAFNMMAQDETQPKIIAHKESPELIAQAVAQMLNMDLITFDSLQIEHKGKVYMCIGSDKKIRCTSMSKERPPAKR